MNKGKGRCGGWGGGGTKESRPDHAFRRFLKLTLEPRNLGTTLWWCGGRSLLKDEGRDKKKACQGHGESDGMMPAIVRRLSSVYLMEKTRGRRRSARARTGRPPPGDEELARNRFLRPTVFPRSHLIRKVTQFISGFSISPISDFFH